MITEQNLIGWLCMARLNWDNDRAAYLPMGVQDALVARGWLVVGDEPDWEGNHDGGFTDAGRAITDIHGPEWGIETIPSEAEA